MEKRETMIRTVSAAIRPYDAVIMAGGTDVMHFCGLPSATVALPQKNENGVRRCLILYGGEELRLYRAALAIEELFGRQLT